MKLIRPDVDPVREKFALARKELSAALIEREDEVDLVLTALVANEHVLLVGPPLEKTASEADADALLREALATEKPSQAAAQVARATGLDRKILYARALELK